MIALTPRSFTCDSTDPTAIFPLQTMVYAALRRITLARETPKD